MHLCIKCPKLCVSYDTLRHTERHVYVMDTCMMKHCKVSHTPLPCHQTCGWAAGHFRILSKDNALPLVAFSLTKTVDKNGKEEARQYTEFDLADKLRQRGWVLPAYTMAPDARWVPCCQRAAAP